MQVHWQSFRNAWSFRAMNNRTLSVLGYIPIGSISKLAGIWRISKAINLYNPQKEGAKSFLAGSILRGVVEMIPGLNLSLLVLHLGGYFIDLAKAGIGQVRNIQKLKAPIHSQ